MRVLGYVVAPLLTMAVILGGAAVARDANPPIAAAQSAAPAATGGLFAGITVSGTGTAVAAPDVAYVTAGVETQAATAKDASDANSSTMAAVIAAIKAQGIADKDIQTVGFSINPVYSQPRASNATPTVTAYRGNNTVSVTVNAVGDAAKVLDAVVQAGANSNVAIRFGIKDATALQTQALAAAVQQAATKAAAVAQAAGVKLTGAYAISEESSSNPAPLAPQVAAAASVASVPVQQGQLSVAATVQVIYTYTR